jgi:hypothetical protein
MTGMDGIELLQQLLALDSSIIVILSDRRTAPLIRQRSAPSAALRLFAEAVRSRTLDGTIKARARHARQDRC